MHMTPRRLTAIFLLPALLVTGCVSTTTTTRTWGEPQRQWARYGRVEQIRETVRRQEGNPAAGAVAGAVIGGLLGSAIGGATHRDRYGRVHRHGSAGGAVVGAVGGAVVGAAASQGSSEERWYEVLVHFEDGATETFVYQGAPPFGVGEDVSLTEQGLARL
jgi:outer membrane lipoprotein SlyB